MAPSSNIAKQLGSVPGFLGAVLRNPKFTEAINSAVQELSDMGGASTLARLAQLIDSTGMSPGELLNYYKTKGTDAITNAGDAISNFGDEDFDIEEAIGEMQEREDNGASRSEANRAMRQQVPNSDDLALDLQNLNAANDNMAQDTGETEQPQNQATPTAPANTIAAPPPPPSARINPQALAAGLQNTGPSPANDDGNAEEGAEGLNEGGGQQNASGSQSSAGGAGDAASRSEQNRGLRQAANANLLRDAGRKATEKMLGNPNQPRENPSRRQALEDQKQAFRLAQNEDQLADSYEKQIKKKQKEIADIQKEIQGTEDKISSLKRKIALTIFIQGMKFAALAILLLLAIILIFTWGVVPGLAGKLAQTVITGVVKVGKYMTEILELSATISEERDKIKELDDEVAELTREFHQQKNKFKASPLSRLRGGKNPQLSKAA